LVGVSVAGLLGFGAASGSASTFPPIGWSQGNPLPSAFTPRWGFSYAYFPPADQVVLFGGAPKEMTSDWYNDTWLFQSGQWVQGPAAPADLTPRGGAAMAYDPAIGKIVLFGGDGAEWPPDNNDTWLYDGTDWTRGPLAPGGLAPRSGAQMVFDPDIGKIVMFGGSGDRPYNETWLFDGTSWSPGPTPPAGLNPRVFFGMAYDPVIHRVVVAGGDGDQDVWFFDGSAWSAGPPLPVTIGPKERIRLVYDPQLGGDVAFGGLGPGAATSQLWMLRKGHWVTVAKSPSPAWPASRLDAGVLWLPSSDALMMFSGIQDLDLGEFGYRDTWFFRDSLPQIASVALSPTPVIMNHNVAADKGAAAGGYGTLKYEYEWTINGASVPGATGRVLSSTMLHVGDRIQVQVRATDKIGIVGPWMPSPVRVVGNQAPAITVPVISPKPPFTYDSIHATVDSITDPDGDTVTLHYVWFVNGVQVTGNDAPTLTPSHFTANNVVDVQITPVDQWGLAGTPRTNEVTVHWNLNGGSAAPGSTVGISGMGFGAGEKVDLHLDSPSGPTLGTVTTDTAGAFPGTRFPLPSPLPGGQHMVYGVGRSSLIAGPGPITVVPGSSTTPTTFSAGETTTFSGTGFVPGELVSVAFPDGAPTTATADVNGSLTVTLVSPPEPYPGTNIIATAPSGSTSRRFYVRPVVTVPVKAVAGASVEFSLTGFGKGEQVTLTFDSGLLPQSFTTDSSGSANGFLTMPATFGSHKAFATGKTSAASAQMAFSLPASMALSPSSGPAGTTVAIHSGPGWIPGEVVHLKVAGVLVADLVADATGAVNTNWTVTGHSGNTQAYRLYDDVLQATADATFQIT
jgi:hypothetical protein